MVDFCFVRQNKESLIFDFNLSEISLSEIELKLRTVIKAKLSNKIIFNMNDVVDFDYELAEYFYKLSQKYSRVDFSFYNLSPVLNSLLYIYSLDKYFGLYATEEDAIGRKNTLVKRRLKLVCA